LREPVAISIIREPDEPRSRPFRSALGGALAAAAVLAPVVAASPASAHQIQSTNGWGQFGSANGIYGPLCSYKFATLDHGSYGWLGTAFTRLQGNTNCDVWAGAPAGALVAVAQVKRADGTYCAGIASGQNASGSYLAFAQLVTCTDATGSRQTISAHSAQIYGTGYGGNSGTPLHDPI
jgi:hypothetical protein